MLAKFAFTCVFAMLVAAAFTGCGDDDEENQNPSQAALARCNALCDKQAAAQCGVPVDGCKQLCSAVTGTARCIPYFESYHDCQNGLANVCDPTTCQSQLIAAGQCLVPDAGAPG